MKTTLIDVLARHLWTAQLSTRHGADRIEAELWAIAELAGVADAVVDALERTEARYLRACERAVRSERRRLAKLEASHAKHP